MGLFHAIRKTRNFIAYIHWSATINFEVNTVLLKPEKVLVGFLHRPSERPYPYRDSAYYVSMIMYGQGDVGSARLPYSTRPMRGLKD